MSAKTIIIFPLLFVLIISIVVILAVFITKDVEKDNESGKSQNTNGDGSSNIDESDEVEKLRGRTIKFQQPEENSPAKHIIVYIPEKEIFI